MSLHVVVESASSLWWPWITLLSCLVLGGAFLYFSPRKPSRSPPLIGQYWWPFLGCAISFGKDPPHFLLQCKQSYGNLFTLNVAGKAMTFMFDYDLFDVFFAPSKSNQVAVDSSGHAATANDGSLSASKNKVVDAVSFDHGVQEFTARVFGLPTEQFLDEHHVLLTSLRTAIAPSTGLPTYMTRLHEYLLKELDEKFAQTQRVDDLFELVSEVLFFSSVRSLFGTKFFESLGTMSMSSVAEKKNSDDKREYNMFKKFDQWFELAASGSVPHRFLPGFLQSKDGLLSILTQLRSDMDNGDGSTDSYKLFETLLISLEKNCRSNVSETEFDERSKMHTYWGLALLWASQANSLPATFWTLAHLLNNDECMEQVKKEIEQVLSQSEDTGSDLNTSTTQQLYSPDRFPYLTACVKEGIRLQAPGIMIRKVCRPVKLSTTTLNGSPVTYIVPKGHTLCISPYVIHRDEAVFVQAEKFNPNRWLLSDKKQLEQMRRSFIPFGRGQNLCPGMNFAMHEMVCFLATFINKFPHVHILRKAGTGYTMPEANVTRMVGVPYPKSALPVSLFK